MRSGGVLESSFLNAKVTRGPRPGCFYSSTEERVHVMGSDDVVRRDGRLKRIRGRM